MSPLVPTSTAIAARARRIAAAAGSLGLAAAACALAAAVVLLAVGVPVIGDATATSAAAAADGSAKSRHQTFATSLGLAETRVTGRSLFFRPAPPVPPRAAPSPRDETPTTPPKPTSYGGPEIIGMINGVVWFADGRRLGPGDDADGDLEVVQINAPWSAQIVWREVEFTVPLFARNTLITPAQDEPTEPPDPGPSSDAPGDGPEPPLPPEEAPEVESEEPRGDQPADAPEQPS